MLYNEHKSGNYNSNSVLDISCVTEHIRDVVFNDTRQNGKGNLYRPYEFSS